MKPNPIVNQVSFICWALGPPCTWDPVFDGVIGKFGVPIVFVDDDGNEIARTVQ